MLTALFAPILAPVHGNDAYKMPQSGYAVDPQTPNSVNILGTTENQYDLYYGIVWGTRMAFKVGITVVFFALIIGIIVGGAAGFLGGWIDEVLMRCTDIVCCPVYGTCYGYSHMLGPDLKEYDDSAYRRGVAFLRAPDTRRCFKC